MLIRLPQSNEIVATLVRHEASLTAENDDAIQGA